jgi:lactate racemase
VSFETARPIELNRVLFDFDRTIIVGGVNFHYFAGFGGGRKMICPGLASAATTAATHRLAFDFGKVRRAEGVEGGRLDGNPVHEAFVEAVEHAPPSFSINTIVDSRGAAAAIYCGDWQAAHLAACDAYAASHTISIAERRPLVIVSAGGSPYDINLIQAHKALDAAAEACEPGGTILLAAECREGTGRGDFLDWFSEKNSEALARRLAAGYKVNGQTAWSLLQKAEKFDVRIVSSLDPEAAAAMRLTPYSSLEMALAGLDAPAWVIPQGSRIKIANS